MDDLISRQAAIDALKNDMASLDHIIQGMSGYDVRLDAYVSQRNQVNCDIDTINNLPTAQPEPCEDAVSRKAAIDGLNEYFVRIGKLKRRGLNKGEKAIRLDTVGTINSLPPAQPEQRTGKWIPSDSQCGIRCSACGAPVDDFCHSIDYIDLVYEPNFCPNCGAKMEGDAE